MRYTEVIKDLFTVDVSHVLAHCISVDGKMGEGIAVEFCHRYPNMKKDLLRRKLKVGQAQFYYEMGKNPVFNLITKHNYWHKPTYESLGQSLNDLKNQLVKWEWTKLSLPMIGAGLDRLDWKKNREMVQMIFQHAR